MQKRTIITLGILFTITTLVMRLVPHPWNFVPMGALVLFSGFMLPKQWLWLPILALALSDILIGTYQWQVMLAVYASYAVMMGVAYTLRQYYSFGVALAGSVAAAVLFFLATNFAHWLWFGGYTRDAAGLLAAYIAGIPFFRNSLFGYVFYSSIFFGAYELVKLRAPSRAAARART